MSETAPLVSADWLAERLDAPDIRIVDASWYLPDQNRNARAEYADAHIPGAVFFDLDDMADEASPYPNMLPPPPKFSTRVRKLGLGDGNRIICYDGSGLFSAARAWWMFKVMGYKDVAVLDGGLPKWQSLGHPVTDIPTRLVERHFTPRIHGSIVRSAEEVDQARRSGAEQILDARSAERFAGATPEPRPEIRAGHIPGSCNLPYKQLLAEDQTVLPVEHLRSRMKEAGIDLTKPVITTCGSGITAAILILALEIVGHRHHALYDGSWAEWGSRADLEIEISA